MTNMASGNSIAEIAALIGDTARANILWELMGGQALTAGELARAAGVSAQTTSGHLAKLQDAGLIALASQQGRHRYFRIASPEIAHVMEALSSAVARGPKRYRPPGPKDEAMRFARTCYDHMAGRLGTAVTDALCRRGHVILSDGAGVITEEGHRFLCDFGIDLEPAKASKRPLCKACLDWSERRPHLAGWLGAALLNRSLALGWVISSSGSRALQVTKAGHAGFSSHFEVALEHLRD